MNNIYDLNSADMHQFMAIQQNRNELYQLFHRATLQLQHMVRVLYKYGVEEMVDRYCPSRVKDMINYLERIDNLNLWSINFENKRVYGSDLLNSIKERYAERILLKE